MRIVRHRVIPRVAAASLAATAGAAAVLFVIWQLWHTEAVVEPYRTQFEHREPRYKCEQGHSWTAKGQIEPRLCPDCGKPAYPSALFSCPKHGTFELAAKFVRSPDGKARQSEFRFAGQDWFPAKGGPLCPRCGEKLTRQREDPLADLVRKRKNGG